MNMLIFRSGFQKTFIIVFVIAVGSIFQACNFKSKEKAGEEKISEKKIGILLVSHGSRSKSWQSALFQLEQNVKDSVMKISGVAGTKTAFMEYVEPSISTQLKEFDKEGYTDIIVIPIFLTVSTHSFDDIPTVIGQKEDPVAMEHLKAEGIEIYKPKAKTQLAPLLDFTDVLKKNVLRRAKALSKDPQKEGLVLIAYGDNTYFKEWKKLMEDIESYVKNEIGFTASSYGWCGHIVHHNPKEITKVVNKVLATKEQAIVIPVLVSIDEHFQNKIIGGGIEKVPDYKKKVIYRPDAILPDENVERWVIDISKKYIDKIYSADSLQTS